jgi:hypothetical protein
VTISTPNPLDRPDWYNAASYATVINYAEIPACVGVGNFGYFYVGDAPAFGFVIEVTGGAWELSIASNNGAASSFGGVMGGQYIGNTDCTIHDNIPTASAWVNVEMTGGTFLNPLDVKLWWWQSQTPEPGATLCLDMGLGINVNAGACPHGAVTNFPSALLLPGVHQYCFDVSADMTGVANLSGLEGTALNGRMVRIFDPTAATGYDGQVIVSHIQPVWQVNNEGGADVTVNATLTLGI